VPLTGSATVRSRVLHGSVWSALNEATFSVGTVAPAPGNLIISKIMWKPAPPSEADLLAGFADDSEFEFLELYNPSANPVDLTGIGLSAGLDIEPLSPAPADLAPGRRAVLVAKPSAFLHRHGNTAAVVGKFVNGSNLSGSERLTLVDSAGTTIDSFVYNNPATGPWPKTETSGTGAALVLIRPELLPDRALGTNWRASDPALPAPGSDDRPDLHAWQLSHFGGPADLAADPDADGLPNLVEFALGLDPNAFDDPSRRPAIAFTTEPGPAVEFSFRHHKFLENLEVQVEHSTDLETWSADPGPLETLPTRDHGDGTETVCYRCALTEEAPARYFRLRVLVP
jgi:hypothetical protein